ncbi:hypothetical protein RHSIM_Rhsim11G0005200 [Rhododendron simsii]|uniref:Transposase n=1 Tax=Rhododendron simsii TaxID=118357 RepID=A0A834L8X4_RHOSS|nr:hypothetical protein RHSIM_Rhsim11G0005200 [Rhododendron simsii]
MWSFKMEAKDLTWHSTHRSSDAKMRHPVGSPTWKTIDDKWPSFSAVPRNLRLGLAIDGFNPFWNLSLTYSCWLVMLVMYNLPPWLWMKKENILLTLLILGPKQLGNDIDVYLQPLIKDLQILWTNGAPVYDRMHTEELKNSDDSLGLQKNKSLLLKRHADNFSKWLREKIQVKACTNNELEILQWLANGPRKHAMSCRGYIINGQWFHTKEAEKSTQNSGVSIDAATLCRSSVKDNAQVVDVVSYYGVIKAPPRGFYDLEMYEETVDTSSRPQDVSTLGMNDDDDDERKTNLMIRKKLKLGVMKTVLFHGEERLTSNSDNDDPSGSKINEVNGTGPRKKKACSSAQPLRKSQRTQEQGGSTQGAAQAQQPPTSPTEQTDMFCSPHTVVGCMETPAIPSRTSQNLKRKRGPTKLKTIAIDGSSRIEVKFDENGEPIGEGSVKLSSFLGTLVREIVPYTFSDWRKLPPGMAKILWQSIKTSTRHFMLIVYRAIGLCIHLESTNAQET